MNYAQLLFPDFSLIVCGYLICRFTALNRTVWEQVDNLVYYFLFPVLLFHSIVRSPLDLWAASSLIGAAMAMVSVNILITYSIARWPGVLQKDFASTAQVAFRFNSFIALAITERLAGRDGLLMVAVIIGVCVPLCNVPSWAEITVTRIGQASLALGLLAAGAGMQLGRVFDSRSKRLVGAGVLTMRHLAMPLLAWCMIRLFDLNPLQATVLLVYSALPTAPTSYVLAARMGYDGSFAAGLVTLSTALATLSLPFALQYLH
jgi:malonate transporter and related proteins